MSLDGIWAILSLESGNGRNGRRNAFPGQRSKSIAYLFKLNLGPIDE